MLHTEGFELDPECQWCLGRILKSLDFVVVNFLCSTGKESTCSVGDLGLIPALGRSPGEGNSYPLWYSGLENSMDRGAWKSTVHGIIKSWIQLRDFDFHFERVRN